MREVPVEPDPALAPEVVDVELELELAALTPRPEEDAEDEDDDELLPELLLGATTP